MVGGLAGGFVLAGTFEGLRDGSLALWVRIGLKE